MVRENPMKYKSNCCNHIFAINIKDILPMSFFIIITVAIQSPSQRSPSTKVRTEFSCTEIENITHSSSRETTLLRYHSLQKRWSYRRGITVLCFNILSPLDPRSKQQLCTACWLRFVYPVFPVSLDFPFCIAHSVFSNVYFAEIHTHKMCTMITAC